MLTGLLAGRNELVGKVAHTFRPYLVPPNALCTSAS